MRYDRTAVGNDPTAFQDGESETVTEATAPVGTPHSGLDSMIMGENLGGGQDYNGWASCFCIWDVALSDDEMGALGKGIHPFGIRSQDRIILGVLAGLDSPEPAINEGTVIDLTVAGATKAPTNPAMELMENYL